jgi:hypothetical protein
MNLSQFILRLQLEEEATADLFDHHDINPANPFRGRGQRPKEVDRETQIEAIVKKYVTERNSYSDRLQFLKAIQYHLASTF